MSHRLLVYGKLMKTLSERGRREETQRVRESATHTHTHTQTHTHRERERERERECKPYALNRYVKFWKLCR